MTVFSITTCFAYVTGVAITSMCPVVLFIVFFVSLLEVSDSPLVNFVIHSCSALRFTVSGTIVARRDVFSSCVALVSTKIASVTSGLSAGSSSKFSSDVRLEAQPSDHTIVCRIGRFLHSSWKVVLKLVHIWSTGGWIYQSLQVSLHWSIFIIWRKDLLVIWLGVYGRFVACIYSTADQNRWKRISIG